MTDGSEGPGVSTEQQWEWWIAEEASPNVAVVNTLITLFSSKHVKIAQNYPELTYYQQKFPATCELGKTGVFYIFIKFTSPEDSDHSHL